MNAWKCTKNAFLPGVVDCLAKLPKSERAKRTTQRRREGGKNRWFVENNYRLLRDTAVAGLDCAAHMRTYANASEVVRADKSIWKRRS